MLKSPDEGWAIRGKDEDKGRNLLLWTNSASPESVPAPVCSRSTKQSCTASFTITTLCTSRHLSPEDSSVPQPGALNHPKRIYCFVHSDSPQCLLILKEQDVVTSEGPKISLCSVTAVRLLFLMAITKHNL